MSGRVLLQVTILAAVTGGASPAATAATDASAGDARLPFADAAAQYRPLKPAWFLETQAALRAEADRVAAALEADGQAEAAAWKRHLHWDLLETSLSAPLPGNRGELALVRRWMYSNKPGLETERFAELRRAVDAHLDAVIALSEVDLQAAVVEKAAEAAALCRKLAANPNEQDASRLGPLLGWFDRVQQLPEEVAAARRAYSHPNLELVVSEALIRRVVASQTGPISESISLRDRTVAPATGPLQRERTLQVRGQATTEGVVTVDVVEDLQRAKFHVFYEGTLRATCSADAGPAKLHLTATGDATAVKPVYFGHAGLESGAVEVDPRVTSRLNYVSSRSNLIRRIAERRARHPASQAVQQAEARNTAVEQLQTKLNEQVVGALDQIRTEAEYFRSTLSGLGDLSAPLAREGALPYFESARTTPDAMVLGVMAGNRDQLGAALPPPAGSDADFTLRVHVSMLNNMAETITGGKRLNDKFFMRYGNLVHAELPLPLMVHSRAGRWAVWARKHRPLEVTFPEANQFELSLRLDEVEIEDQTFRGPATLRVRYALVETAFGELWLERLGELQVSTDLPLPARRLLAEKFGAFFGPVLNGGGVIVPTGGPLGALKALQVARFQAAGEWLVAEMNAPDALIEEVNRWRSEAPALLPDAP